MFVACTTVDCLPSITGQEKLGRVFLLIPLGNTFGFRQLREQRLKVLVMSYNPTLFEASDWWKASNCGTILYYSV